MAPRPDPMGFAEGFFWWAVIAVGLPLLPFGIARLVSFYPW